MWVSTPTRTKITARERTKVCGALARCRVLLFAICHLLFLQEEEFAMKQKSSVWGYALAALGGVVVGGVAVAIVGRIIPKLMERMMAEFPRRMMAQMRAAGHDPAEMCRRMMAEFANETPA